MYKEDSAYKLIEYIQTLPAREQRLIAESISGPKVQATKKNATSKGSKGNENKKMAAFLDSLGSRLPKNYKFNREEANER